MKLFGLPVENAVIVDIRDDGTGWMLYHIRYQYVERATPDAVWYTWLYAEDVPELLQLIDAAEKAVKEVMAVIASESSQKSA